MILTVAGFGQPTSWETQSEIPVGHKMTFATAIYLVSTRMLIRIITPTWALGFTKYLRETRTAFEELNVRVLSFSFPSTNDNLVVHGRDDNGAKGV